MLAVNFRHFFISYYAGQKISPDSKEKVQLQLVMHDGGANTFHFINPKGRAAAVADRDSVKDLLQQLIPKFRRKLSSELEEKNRFDDHISTTFYFYIRYIQNFSLRYKKGLSLFSYSEAYTFDL